MRARFLALTLLLPLALADAAAAAERTFRLDPAATTIRFRVKARAHQVLGTMPLVSGELRFDPATGTAGGEIVMDPGRAETGINRRDRTMRDEVFEVQRFPRLVFRPKAMAGEVPTAGAGTVRLEGTLDIHGGEHPVELPVTLQVSDGAVRATTTFVIPYVSWGMKNPGNAMLAVADTVEVRIETSGRLD
jgi:polyisoprenoid-binding protein YceI